MIHEEICTYEVCKLAKEKGFPQHIVNDAYVVDNEYDDEYEVGNNCYQIQSIPDYLPTITAPTQSLLQRWLREEKGYAMSVTAYPTLASLNKVCYAWEIKSSSDGVFMKSVDSEYTFSTYELALEDALAYSLKNLV